MPSLPYLIGGLIILGLAAAIVTKLFDRKRTRQFEETARDLGLNFSKEVDSTFAEIQGSFDLLARGRSRRGRNMVFGEKGGTGVWVFDYRYTTGSGKHSRTHRQTVVCFRAEELQLPKFSLEAEGMMSRIGSKLFGMQDIDFDTHPAFSDKFLLRGESEALVRQAFTPEVLTFFEGQGKKLRVEGNGSYLLVYRASRRVKPADVGNFLQEGFGIFNVLRHSVIA
jgi:hypothetical protein